jgi:hypothetical protein
VRGSQVSQAGTSRPKWRRPRILAIVVIFVLVGSIVASQFIGSSPLTPNQKSIDSALRYITHRYDNYLGLVSTSPGSQTFSLLPDNFIASLALRGFSASNQTYGNLAAILNITAEGYLRTIPASNLFNVYLLLNSTGHSPPFECPTTYTTAWVAGPSESIPVSQEPYRINLTLNDNSQCTLIPQQDAAVSFLEIWYYYKTGAITTAVPMYINTASYFDGTGIADTQYKTPTSPTYHHYQTATLALYLYVTSCWTFSAGKNPGTVPVANITSSLERLQDNSTGGFYSSYGPGFDTAGSSTTTLATSLAALALEASSGLKVC